MLIIDFYYVTKIIYYDCEHRKLHHSDNGLFNSLSFVTDIYGVDEFTATLFRDYYGYWGLT